MARIRATRGNFITGKLSVEAQANTDSEVYNFGLELCENFLLKPLGGAYKRSGTQYLRFLDHPISISRNELITDRYIRFFDFYYEDRKILFFLTSGDVVNPSLLGFLNEDGGYCSNTFYFQYSDSVANAGEIFLNELELKEVSFCSVENKVYLFIPNANTSIFNERIGLENFSTNYVIEYASGGIVNLSNVGSEWESEPLFPIDRGQQLLVSCVSEDALPWRGDLSRLKIYASLLDKDGAPIESQDILDKFIDLNVLFKFVKTQTYPAADDGAQGADRNLANSDRFAAGPYWIGAKVKRSELEPSPYFELELKEEIQKQLFPITANNDVGNRNKKSQISQWFVTAFNRTDPKTASVVVSKGYIGKFPGILLPYKGRLHIFYKNWIFGSALGKSPLNFSMGESSDDAFCVGWGDGKIGYVKWAFAASKMIIGASGGIFFSDSIVQNSGDQTSYQLPEMLTNISPSDVLPTLIGQSIIFVGSDNRSVYEIKLVGQEGPSVSKINAHCMGLFTEDITKIESDNDYLYAIGDGGQCNVCCFAQTGFARRWFTYTFGGTAACLYDIYFNSLLPRSSSSRKAATFPPHCHCELRRSVAIQLFVSCFV